MDCDSVRAACPVRRTITAILRHPQHHSGAVIAMACLLLLLLGCTAEQRTAEQQREIIAVEFSFGAEDIEIYHGMELLLNRAIAESGKPISINYRYAYTDPDIEASNVAAALAERPDVLVIMPLDSRTVLEYIRQADDAEIPVIVYNRAADPHPQLQPAAFVGLDTVDQAYTTAVGLIQRVIADGKRPKLLNVMGDLRDRNALNRNIGLRRAAEETGAEILASVETHWIPELAETGLKNALELYPEANSVFVASDWLMTGVRAALEAGERWVPYGREGHMYIGSQDVFPLGARLIRDGYVVVNTSFDIWPMSTTLVQSIVSIAAGDELSQRVFLIPGRIVTARNLDTMGDLWYRSLDDLSH